MFGRTITSESRAAENKTTCAVEKKMPDKIIAEVGPRWVWWCGTL